MSDWEIIDTMPQESPSYQLAVTGTTALTVATQEVYALSTAVQTCQSTFESSIFSPQGRADLIIDAEFREISSSIETATEAQEELNQVIVQSSGLVEALKKGIGSKAAEFFSIQNAKEMMEMSDQILLSQKKLDAVNDNNQSTDQLRQMLDQSAQRSGSSRESMERSFVAMEQNGGDVFASNGEAILMAETLNKQFAMAGLSGQEITARTLEMAQAMGQGVMSGETLKGVFQETPAILQAMADYMGMSTKEVENLATQGAISAETFKHAMLSSADEVNSSFAQSPKTFAQTWSTVQNEVSQALEPIYQTLSQLGNDPAFLNLVDRITQGLTFAADVGVQAFSTLAEGALWVMENWSTFEPILMGVAAAIGAYALATQFSAAANLQWLGTFTLNPLFLLIGLAVGVVWALASWVQQLGGVEIAWMMLCNGGDYAMAQLGIGITWLGNLLASWCNQAVFGFYAAAVGIQDALSFMKVGGLMILQEFINGAIGYINQFINLMNMITGSSVKTIDELTFATEIAVEEEAKRQQRANGLAQRKAEQDQEEAMASAELTARKVEAEAMREQGKLEVERAREKLKREAESQQEKSFSYNPDAYSPVETPPASNYLAEYAANAAPTVSNVTPAQSFAADRMPTDMARTADNTQKMADTVDLAEEDLKYMREAAEQEIINRFTLAELKVDVNNNNTLRSINDFDEIQRCLLQATDEILRTAAEGVF